MSDDTEAGKDPLYDAERDLEERLRLVTPEFTTRGFLFTATLKTVRDLGGDEAMVQRCLEACGEKDFVDFFSYPTSTLLKLMLAAGRVLGPQYGGFEQALRRIGGKAAESYMSSAVGRSAQLLVGADPKQLVTTLQALYKVVMTYAEPSVVWTGQKSGILVVQRTFTPLPYHEGGALVIADRLGLKNVKVRARNTGALSIEMDVSWE